MEIRFEFPIAYDSRCLQTNSVAVDMGSLVFMTIMVIFQFIQHQVRCIISVIGVTRYCALLHLQSFPGTAPSSVDHSL